MMKRKAIALCFILIASMLVIFTGCSKQNEVEDLKLGRYVLQEETEIDDFAWVLLKENSEFEFNRGITTSYRPTGTYLIEDGMLPLYVSEEESYIFTIDGDNLIFKRGEFADGIIEEGAIFKLSDIE